MQCSRADLEFIDQYAVQNLDKILECTEESFTDSSFNEKFVTYLSNGTEVELVPGGKNIAVTYENRLDYVKEVLHTRFNESRKQVSHCRLDGYIENLLNLNLFHRWKPLSED